LPLTEIEPWFFGRPAGNQPLYWLSYVAPVSAVQAVAAAAAATRQEQEQQQQQQQQQ
jgi:hypothetical protein